MLSTPQKRVFWARSERFADFSEISFFRALLERRRRPERVVREQRQRRPGDNRWKPAAWTPWLWIK